MGWALSFAVWPPVKEWLHTEQWTEDASGVRTLVSSRREPKDELPDVFSLHIECAPQFVDLALLRLGVRVWVGDQ